MNKAIKAILGSLLVLSANAAAQDAGSLSTDPDIYLNYPDMTDFVVCQQDEVSALVEHLAIKEDKYLFAPGIYRFAYSLLGPKSDSVLFTLECADLTGHEVNGRWVSWPEQYSFRAVLWVHTWNPTVTGPANSVVGKSTYKDLKTLNWTNHSERDFMGCEKYEGRDVFVCMGERVWMEFTVPDGLNPKGAEDLHQDVMDQAVLTQISIRTSDLTWDKLPRALQIYLKARGDF